MTCNTCPRVYHNKCLNIPQTDEHTDGLQEPKDSNEWTCYECQVINLNIKRFNFKILTIL